MERTKYNKALIKKHGGQWLPFGFLPETHQKALIVYSFGCAVQWKDIRDQDIKEFQKEEKERSGLYGIATIPMQVAIKDFLRFQDQERKDHDSFEAYHKWYISYEKDERFILHKQMWPVLLSSYDDEWIQDGWHRFHSYYAQKRTKVPVLMYPV